MSDAAYIFAGYAVTAAVVAAYVGWIMRKARTLRPPRPVDPTAAPPPAAGDTAP